MNQSHKIKVLPASNTVLVYLKVQWYRGAWRPPVVFSPSGKITALRRRHQQRERPGRWRCLPQEQLLQHL